MNVKFAPGSVRWRISKQEVDFLLNQGKISQEIKIGRSNLELVVELRDVPLCFEFDGMIAQMRVSRDDLVTLTNLRPTRETSLRYEIVNDSKDVTTIIFEIDLFSFKKGEGTHAR